MALPTYLFIAQATGTDRCRGIKGNGQKCFVAGHDKGVVDGGTVHWADRVPTKAGIKRFLWLASDLHYVHERAVWRRRLWRVRLTLSWLMLLHVRVPASAWAHEKAELRAMLVKVPTGEPDRAEAMAWASRR